MSERPDVAEYAREGHPLTVEHVGADAGLVTCACGATWDLRFEVSPSLLMRRPAD